MARGTCSADPGQLDRYASACVSLDRDLQRAAGTLAVSLRHYEGRCLEYRVDVAGLSETMVCGAQASEALAEWVGRVGRAFYEAGAWSADFVGGLWRQYFHPELWDAWVALRSRLDAPGMQRKLEFDVALLGFLGALTNRGDLRAVFTLLGRLSNTLTGNRGHVGQIDDLYQALVVEGVPYRGSVDTILRSKAFYIGSLGLGAAVSSYYDWREGKYGGTLSRSVAVNVVNVGVKYGAVRLVPGVGQVFIVNDAFQLGTKAQVAVHDALADLVATDEKTKLLLKSDAKAIAAASKRADLDNVTKAFSQGVVGLGEGVIGGLVDIARNPSWDTWHSIGADLQKAVEAGYGDPPDWAKSPVGGLLYHSHPLAPVLMHTGAAAIDVGAGAFTWAGATAEGIEHLADAGVDRLLQSTTLDERIGGHIQQALGSAMEALRAPEGALPVLFGAN